MSTLEPEQIERREDGQILQDYAEAADFLIAELIEARKLARKVSDGIWKRSDVDIHAFRDVERKVYAVYRQVGDMSALLDELYDEPTFSDPE